MGKQNKYFTKNRIIIFILLMTFLISFVIPVTRLLLDKPIFPGETPYYDIRISNAILDKGLVFEDKLVSGSREYIAEPYHLILATILNFFDEKYLISISFIAALASMIIFYLLLKRIDMDLEQIFFIMIVLLLSPGFIFAFGTLNDFCISLMLILLGTYMFLRSDKLLPSLFIFLIAVFFSLINVIVIIFLILFLSEINADKKRNSINIITSVLLLAFLYYIPLYFNSGMYSRLSLLHLNSFKEFVSDLGASIGLGAYTLILAIIGFAATWEHKQKLKNIYFLILSLFLIQLYFDCAAIYLTFLCSIFAGIALQKLMKRKWAMGFLKEFTLLIMIYGLVFSAISYTNRVIVSEPDKEIQNALEWLDDNSNPYDVVFSHSTKGLWIEYWADRPAVTDDILDYKDAKQRLEDSNEIFYSRDILKTKDLLDKYDVKYIFVDASMKSGQVWNEQSGLWYLFTNNETFKNSYQKNNIEIWEYLGNKK